MLKIWLRRVLGAFGLAAATTLALAPQAAEARGAPALWSVSDADTTVYLFGTIHLLPENFKWRTAKFDKAVAGSNEPGSPEARVVRVVSNRPRLKDSPSSSVRIAWR